MAYVSIQLYLDHHLDTNMVFLQISILSSIFIPQTMDHCMVTALANQQQ